MTRYEIQSAILKWFSHIKVYPTPMFITFGPTSYKLKGHDYYDVRDHIRPGDVLLRGYDNYLDGFFIPGKYSHAAIYVGDESIIHAMTPAVQYTDLVTFMRCDRLAIIRPNTNHQHCLDAVDRAISLVGVPYDYDFDFTNQGDKRFSCSELIYKCYEDYADDIGWGLKKVAFGKQIFTPDDCLTGHVEIIAKL